jgi:hypothetical protein
MNARDEARAIVATLRALDDDPNARACNPGCPSGAHEHGRSWWGQTADVISALLDEPVPAAEREALVTRAYNIVTGNDGDWNPDLTLSALFELHDSAARAALEAAEATR